MKRTELKRRTPLANRSKVRARRPGTRRSRAWRSKPYLAWVRTLACVLCGARGCQAHHIKGIGHHSGAGMTAPDDLAMPACTRCHARIHADPDLWEAQVDWVAQTQALARAAGWVLP